MLYLLHEAPPEEQNFSMVMEMIAAAEVHVWLAISIDPVYIDTGNWIESAAGLCYECLNDIALDEEMTKLPMTPRTSVGTAEIKAWNPYGQLLEYAVPFARTKRSK